LPDQHIEITREFEFPVEVLFGAWTDPELLEAWLAEDAEVDPRVGGHYRLTSSGDDENPGDHICSGSYVEFEPNKRLVKNWVYEGSMAAIPIETTVSVEFSALGPDSSALRFREEGPMLTDPEENEMAIEAWNAAFDELEEAIEELFAAE
jgi:uncharacterized protein YndB with AHSA1/START domain